MGESTKGKEKSLFRVGEQRRKRERERVRVVYPHLSLSLSSSIHVAPKTAPNAFAFFPSFLVGHHHFDELLVVNLTISIDISLTDHLVDFLIGKLLTEVGHDMTELSSGNETVSVLVEDLESFLDLILRVSILHLTSHHGEELGEIDITVTISVNFVDHVLKLSLGRVLSKRAHDGSELLGGDGTISVLVKEGEGLLELGDLLFSQLLGGVRHGEIWGDIKGVENVWWFFFLSTRLGELTERNTPPLLKKSHSHTQASKKESVWAIERERERERERQGGGTERVCIRVGRKDIQNLHLNVPLVSLPPKTTPPPMSSA